MTEESERYEELIPREIRKAFKALGGDMAWRMFVYLRIKEKATIQEMAGELQIDIPKGLWELDELQKASLVSGFLEKEEGQPPKSVYELSQFGCDIFDFVYEMIEKPVKNTTLAV